LDKLEATLGDKITTVRLGELEVEMVKATSTCIVVEQFTPF